MMFSRSTVVESPAANAAKPPPPGPWREPDAAAQPPRWGLLAMSIVAALATAAWVGNAFSAAQAAATQPASAQPPGK